MSTKKKYTKIEGEVIFADESGNPGLNKKSIIDSPFFVIGFVYCKNPTQLRKRLKRLLKKMHDQKKYPPKLNELKFYLPDSDLIRKGYDIDQLGRYKNNLPEIRNKCIEIICSEATGVFAAVLDKKSIEKSTWTSETIGNYIFAQTLTCDIMSKISPRYKPSILYDKGRLSAIKTKQFKKYLVNKDSYFEQIGRRGYSGKLPIPEERSSYAEPGIWAADIVAGAFQSKFAHVEPSSANDLATKYIGSGMRLYWKQK
jgi:hypothetical protein